MQRFHDPKKLIRSMTPDDCFQATVLAMAETSLNILLSRATPKSRRWNKLMAMKEKLDEVDETFEGYLPDNWIQSSQTFFTTVEAALTTLMKRYKEE